MLTKLSDDQKTWVIMIREVQDAVGAVDRAYDAIKKLVPNMNHLAFERADTYHRHVGGWIHIGNDCNEWKDVFDLTDYLKQFKSGREGKEILFRKF